MATTTLDIKYNDSKTQLDGLLEGDIVTFSLIHTRYYLNPTVTPIKTPLDEFTETVSASIISIERSNVNIIKHNLNIIMPGISSNYTWKVVTTIQFKLLVNNNYIFTFYEFDKFDIKIFIYGGQNPSAKYALSKIILNTHIQSIKNHINHNEKTNTHIQSIKNPLNQNKNTNTPISPIENYLSSIITETEKVNNVLINYINKLKEIQSLYTDVTTELSRIKDNAKLDELKPKLDVLKHRFDELKPRFDGLKTELKKEMVALLNSLGVESNEYKFNKQLIQKTIGLIINTQNDNNQANDLETTIKNAENMIGIMEKDIKDIEELNKIELNDLNDSDAIPKIKKKSERVYTRHPPISGPVRPPENVVPVKGLKTVPAAPDHQIPISYLKSKEPSNTAEETPIDKTERQKLRETRGLNMSFVDRTNTKQKGGKGLNNKTIKNPKPIEGDMPITRRVW